MHVARLYKIVGICKHVLVVGYVVINSLFVVTWCYS